MYPKYVSIGIAGPKKGNTIKMTNAKWPEFNIEEVKKELEFQALYVLNDFEASGYGVLVMTKDMYTEVTKVKGNPEAPKILIGTGTGLGQAVITKSQGEYIVSQGEGGHADFAPRNEIEFGFMLYVKKKLKLNRVSYERCCCGLGIPLMFEYLYETMNRTSKVESKVYNAIREPLEKLQELYENSPFDEAITKQASELDKTIFTAGMKREDKVCEATVDFFVALYGAETGNIALKVLPYGGICLLSSVTLAVKDHIINKPTFLVTQRNKS